MPSRYLPATHHCFKHEVTLLVPTISRYLTAVHLRVFSLWWNLTYPSRPMFNIFSSVNPLERINYHTICRNAVVFTLYDDLPSSVISLGSQLTQRTRTHFYITHLGLPQVPIYVCLLNVWWMNSTSQVHTKLFSNILAHLISTAISYEV